MQILWRSDAITNDIGKEVRVIDLDGEVIIETAVRENSSFLTRLVSSIKYLFGRVPFITSFVITDSDFRDMCDRVSNGGGNSDRENCESI